MFVPGKPLKPSLMFASTARACPSEAPFSRSTQGFTPDLTHHSRDYYPQTLDKAGKAFEGQTL